MSGLYAGHLWLSKSEAIALGLAGRHFMRAYVRLAEICKQKALARFPIAPKLHMMWHLNHRLMHEAAKSEHVLNCMSASCAMDEDFIGKFCFLTRQVSPRTRIQRAMERYFAAVFLRWRRKAQV